MLCFLVGFDLTVNKFQKGFSPFANDLLFKPFIERIGLSFLLGFDIADVSKDVSQKYEHIANPD